MSSSTSGAPLKYLSFFANVTWTPGWNDLKIHGPIEAGGFMLYGTSSMFLVTSVVLLSHCVLKGLLGKIPPAPPAPSAATAGQKTLLNLISMTFPPFLIVMPETVSAFPST